MQAQGSLWEGLSTLSEHLDVLHGTLRELNVRRFRDTDMAAVKAGRFGEAEFLPADEVPDYQEQWQRNRSPPAPQNAFLICSRRIGNPYPLCDCRTVKTCRAVLGLRIMMGVPIAGRQPSLQQWTIPRVQT